ncbi:MAG TPA: PKD domain-containing protein [Ferruginibacter sp.]|nr:PKD domain-containing protein [Ferruginibacter sp.]
MRFNLSFLLLLVSVQMKAQPCSGPGRTPQTAIVVCGTLTFTQNNVSNCTGPALPFAGCANTPTAENVFWYRFHCYQTGTLGFLITPLVQADIDWTVLDITGRPVTDVFTNNLSISTNLSATEVATGCTAAGTGNINCAGNTPVLNAMPTITAGRDYLLMVSRYSSFTTQGYNLAFTGGTAVLTDNQLPAISSTGIVGCNSSQVSVTFSEDVLCNSLTATGSEFTISDGTSTFPFTSITSLCSTGQNAITSLTLNMQNPLPPGSYNLIVNNGTDANTVLDVCNTAMLPTSIPFNVAAQVPLAINNIAYTGCAPTLLKVALSKPVLCSSITSTGSEFSIQPGNPAVASVQTVCGGINSYTDTLLINLQNPLPHGNYQLVVNNGTDGNTLIDTCTIPLAVGYQFPFTITQVTSALAIQSVTFDECKPFRVVVNFDKPVACNSISATGSEFTVSPGGLNVTGITSNCTGSTTTQVVLTLSGNLPAGNFSVNINTGSDGNTVSDSCFAFMPPATAFPFSTTQAPAPVYDSLQYDRCSPQAIKIFYSHSILCNSINLNGSEFSITGPAPVNISSVSTDATCTLGYTNAITLHLSQPINTFGNFTIHNIAGADGNSVLDTCYAAQNVAETISFNVLGRPSAAFNDSVHFGCVTDTLVLSHPGGNGINFWQWTFSDGTILTGQSVMHEFPVTIPTASVQLIVSNGTCSDTLSRTYTLNNAFNAGFTISADTICRNSNFNVINSSNGNNLNYHWNYSDGFSFNGQTPPAHTFTNPGNYSVVLTATDIYGCTSDSTLQIVVTDTPRVSFSGLNNQYCSNDQVNLIANILGNNVSNFTWQNGNGVTFSNQPNVNFTYSNEGSYNIILTATDRFCGDYSYNQTTQIYKVPVFNLGEDITLCPQMTTQIGVDSIAGYTYLWNTGAVRSKIVTGPSSANYRLQVNNHGCMGADEIYVTVLDNCLIKVPTAFTPNNDGLNDRLKAINADLAKEFSLRVFNRFGQLVFSTSVPTNGWDGRFKGVNADAGTYVWMVNYIHPVTGLKIFEKGTSILIR